MDLKFSLSILESSNVRADLFNMYSIEPLITGRVVPSTAYKPY